MFWVSQLQQKAELLPCIITLGYNIITNIRFISQVYVK